MTVPLEEMYQGDFTGWVTQAGAQIPIYDPATTQPNPNGTGSIRTPFPGNKIPASRFSQVAKNYLSIRPPEMTPNVPGSGPRNNYFRSDGGQTNPWNKYSVKIDHNLSRGLPACPVLSAVLTTGCGRIAPGDLAGRARSARAC